MLRLSLMYHMRKIWLWAVNSIRGVWYYGESLLSQFNLTKLSSHESIYRIPIQPLLFVSQTTAIAVLFRSSFHVNLVSSVNYSYSNSPIGSGEALWKLISRFFFFFFLPQMRFNWLEDMEKKRITWCCRDRPTYSREQRLRKNVAWKYKASL